ncbi:MAG: hypothetical protein ACLVJ6_17475 [Merdibacter sp.]
MAEEKVTEELEEELSEELQREANSIRYGNAHRNIHITVNRMARVDQNLIDSYNRVAPELLMLSSDCSVVSVPLSAIGGRAASDRSSDRQATESARLAPD